MIFTKTALELIELYTSHDYTHQTFTKIMESSWVILMSLFVFRGSLKTIATIKIHVCAIRWIRKNYKMNMFRPQ